MSVLVFIVQIVLVLSLGGLFLIAVHKIPALLKLPKVAAKRPAQRKKQVVSKIKTSASSIKQKLSEVKTSEKQALEEDKKQKKNQVDSDSDYWDKIKKE